MTAQHRRYLEAVKQEVIEEAAKAHRHVDPVDALVEELGIFTEALELDGWEWEQICEALKRVEFGLRKAYEAL
jgi:hypothetical protein